MWQGTIMVDKELKDAGGRVADGSDPSAYMISLNLERRHLDGRQRAMAAAKIANMRQGNEQMWNFRKLTKGIAV
jgi:hypothetical protein